MALAGKLKEFGLADIFQLIGMQKKTGVLSLKSSTDAVQVLFVDGKIVHADSQSKESEDRLGTVLVKRGLITEAQLSSALEKQKQTLRRLGHILVVDGFLKREQMQEALYRQVTTILFRLFRWKDGEFNFNQDETLEYDHENFVPIPPESVLMEGVQMMDEWPIIEKKIRSMDQVFTRVEMDTDKVQLKKETEDDDLDGTFDWEEQGEGATPEIAHVEDVIQLSKHEWAVYQALDGKLPVREICFRSPLNEFGTCRTLYDLVSRTLISEVQSAKKSGEESVSPVLVRESHALLSRVGSFALMVVFLVSILTFWNNPYSPLTSLFKSGTPASSIGGDISRLRLQRIDYSIQVYTLQYGTLPPHLSALQSQGFVSDTDLHDPWGAAYTYQPAESEYTLTGFDAEGQVDPDLIIFRDAGQVPTNKDSQGL